MALYKGKTIISDNGSNIIVDDQLNLESTNPVQNKVLTEKLNEVFQSVSNGKTLIASAITDKGVNTEATDTFQTMADNIGMIQSGAGSRGIVEPINNKSNLTTSAKAEIKS